MSLFGLKNIMRDLLVLNNVVDCVWVCLRVSGLSFVIFGYFKGFPFASAGGSFKKTS